MRKYLFNIGVLSSAFGVIGLIRATIKGPVDWRLILMWVSWALGVAIAVGAVVQESREAELED